MTRRICFLLPAVLALVLALAACGGDDNGDDGAEESMEEDITMVDVAADPSGALAFDPTSLSAPAGEMMIRFTNDSGVDHDVVIEGVDDAQTDVISEGTDSFEVMLEAGEYTFFCSVPGHRGGGMEGTLTVE